MGKSLTKTAKMLSILCMAAALLFSLTGCDELANNLDDIADTDTGQGEDTGTNDENTPDSGEVDDTNPLPPSPSNPAFVFNDLKIDNAETIDLDGDEIPDNAMGKNLGMIRVFLNSKLTELIQEGSFLMLSEFVGINDPVQTEDFSINMLIGVNTKEDPTDNFSGHATINVSVASYDDLGQPAISLQDTTIEDSHFTARGSELVIDFPLPSGPIFHATLYNAVMIGTIEPFNEGLSSVLIGGAIKQADLEAALDLMPGGGSYDSATLMQILGDPDIDTDEDQVMDAFSIAFSGSAVRASLGYIVPYNTQTE